jgi:hypothetical protein
MTRLGQARSGLESVLATTQDGEPLLVTRNYGDGRVLAFGGDSTWKWVRNPDMQELHGRFWRRMVTWLARQENAEGNVWVEPDTRRLPARSELGFRVGVRGKAGTPLADGTFKVEVIGPGGQRTPVPTARAGDEDRGLFTRTDLPGEYRVVVQGEARDPSTSEVVKGEGSARFIVYEEEVELLRRAADHEFLRKLVAAGGGEFHRVEELPAFLRKLQGEALLRARPKLNLWPDWRTSARSPFLAFFVLTFAALLTAEWLLRRRWGLV